MANIDTLTGQDLINYLESTTGVPASTYGDLSTKSDEYLRNLIQLMADIGNRTPGANERGIQSDLPFVRRTAYAYALGYGSQGLPANTTEQQAAETLRLLQNPTVPTPTPTPTPTPASTPTQTLTSTSTVETGGGTTSATETPRVTTIYALQPVSSTLSPDVIARDKVELASFIYTQLQKNFEGVKDRISYPASGTNKDMAEKLSDAIIHYLDTTYWNRVADLINSSIRRTQQ